MYLTDGSFCVTESIQLKQLMCSASSAGCQIKLYNTIVKRHAWLGTLKTRRIRSNEGTRQESAYSLNLKCDRCKKAENRENEDMYLATPCTRGYEIERFDRQYAPDNSTAESQESIRVYLGPGL